MVLQQNIAPPPLIANIRDGEHIVGVLSKETDSTIASVHYKPWESR